MRDRRDKVLALGKFDAMHRGHRCLIEAASHMGGQPYLLSLWGMGEVRSPVHSDTEG